MKKLDKNIIKEKIKWAKENDGVTWINMGWLDDGRELALVFGWEHGYTEDKDLIQKKVGGDIYTLCAKLAVNIDDLQCDYDFDWYMPYAENGDVWDTSTAISENCDFDWYIKESEEILKAFKKGEITV